MSHENSGTSSTGRRRFLRNAGTLAVSTAIAGCSGSKQNQASGDGSESTQKATTKRRTKTPEELSPAEWRKEMAEKAKEELQDEKIQWGTAIRDPALVQKWTSAWNNEYPELTDKVNAIQGRSSQVRQRIVREAKAGKVSTDITDVQMLPVINEIPFEKFTGIPAFDALSSELKQFDNKVGAWSILQYVPSYNTELVSTPPESWEDFMADRFADKKITIDFTPNALRAANVMMDKGEDWLKNWAKTQNPRFVKSGAKITQLVADGSAHMAWQSIGPHIARFQRKGLPIKPVPSTETWIWAPKKVFLPGNSRKHPASAKLFADHLMRTKNASLQAAREGMLAVDMETTLKPSWLQFFDGEVWTVPEAEKELGMKQAEIIERYQKLIGAPVV